MRRLYSTGGSHDVWTRLTLDARGRSQRTQLSWRPYSRPWPEYIVEGNSFYSQGNLSG